MYLSDCSSSGSFANASAKSRWRTSLGRPPTASCPLNVRELEVMQLLASGVSGPRVTERLFVSINTVKSHIKKHLR
jgi:ATP/maltotriose-dependent transcriptional regulator MalT